MAEPSLGDVHVDAALTDYSVALYQEESKFVARQFSPVQGVAKKSDKYFITTQADLLRTDAQKRAPGTRSAERTFTMSTDTYDCDVFSIAYNVSEQVRSNSDPAVDIERSAAKVLMNDILMRMEVDFAAAAFVTGVWGTSATPAVTWDDASSTPIEDFATAIDTIEAATGFTPNTLLLGGAVWRELRHHPDIIARLPDNSLRVAQTADLGAILDFDRVLVAKAIRNTADEGATASISRINTDSNAVVAFVDPNAGIDSATAMKTFTWSGLIGGAEGIRTKRFEVPVEDALPRVEVDAAYDFKIVTSSLGYAFITAVA